jgi:Rrf2 family transcriptional regulator, nitric oxide-sensitive transcriptional repressor
VQLTRFSDYAVRLLILLALREGQTVTVGGAADLLGVSRHHLVKVAHLLVCNAYLSGVRGRKGGVQLIRPPAEISIGAILRLTEPGFCLVACMSSPGACSLERSCGLPACLRRGIQAFLAIMDATALSDILRDAAADRANRNHGSTQRDLSSLLQKQ